MVEFPEQKNQFFVLGGGFRYLITKSVSINSEYFFRISGSNFDKEDRKRFKFGFIASSDNHRSRPGTGYKEIDRFVTTEANGPSSQMVALSTYRFLNDLSLLIYTRYI